MTRAWNEAALEEAAKLLVVQTAALLPTEAAPVSARLEEKIAALLWKIRRQRQRRSLWQRTIAALLALAVALGAVLAVSPQAQAAAKRWWMKVTDVVTAYWFAPTSGDAAPWEGLPQWTPEGSELTFDMEGSNGVRTLRYATAEGDILLQRILLGGQDYTLELRSRESDGLSDLQGQRPMGEAGAPEGYTIEETSVGGHEARRYTFTDEVDHYGDGSGDFAIRCYQDGEWVHHVAIPAGAEALIWTDEMAGELFLLIGGDGGDLQKMAESIYRKE